MIYKVVVALMLGLVVTLAQAEEIEKIGLDSVSAVSPRIEADTEVKVEGTGSVKITANWPTTVCLGEVVAPNVENARLVYSAKVKSELEVTGTAFLEMWAHVEGGQYFSKGMNDTVSEKTDWKTIQTPFLFQKGQKPEKVTLNIVINGQGTVWVDDIVLTTEPLE